MIGYVDESVGIDHLVNCLADNASAGGDGIIRCYVGFEPSGKAHIGWKVISLQMKRMLDAGANVLIFLADWHAWVNDKFGGVMEDIQTTADLHGRNLQRLYWDTLQREKVQVNLDSCGLQALWTQVIIGLEFYDAPKI